VAEDGFVVRIAANLTSKSGELMSEPWESRRGIESTDYNNSLILVRASMDQLANALAPHTTRWERDVLGREIVLNRSAAFVFRLRGHGWTIIAPTSFGPGLPTQAKEQELSRLLNTRVISYWVTDTCGGIGYQLFENGQQLEAFVGMESGDKPGKGSKFFSQLRKITLKNIRNIWGFSREFLISQDTFEPGISFDYFIGHQDYGHDAVMRIENPGFTTVYGMEREVTSTPPIERVDYFETPSPMR
jgi:hypothetical protein